MVKSFDSWVQGDYKIPMGRARATLSDGVCKGLSLEIRKNGEGSWRFRFSFNGVPQCITLGSLKEVSLERARALVFSNKEALKSGAALFQLQRGVGKTVRCPKYIDFIDHKYYPYIKTYKRSPQSDQTLLNNHLLPEFGQLKMNEITHVQILNFVQKKLAANYKPSYCNRLLVLLGFCFNLAIKWEVPGVMANPVKKVPLLKFNNKIENYLKPEESERLFLSVASSPNKLLRHFVTIAILTGARKNELLTAKWIDFDLENRLWRIPMTKSGKPRTVPLSSEAIVALENLWQDLLASMSGMPQEEIQWVFLNAKTGKPLRYIFHSWDTARKKAGLPNLRIHDLRHSFASALVNSGVPLYDVQKLLGHQSISTTERYSHLSADRLRESASVAAAYYSSITA